MCITVMNYNIIMLVLNNAIYRYLAFCIFTVILIQLQLDEQEQ